MSREITKFESITLAELRELWPDSADGKLCGRLLQRYGFSILVKTAQGSACSLNEAPAESGALKAIAKMVEDFGTLGTAPLPPEPRKPLPSLHRFQTEKPEDNPEKK